MHQRRTRTPLYPSCHSCKAESGAPYIAHHPSQNHPTQLTPNTQEPQDDDDASSQASSPEPATQRRRTSGAHPDDDAYASDPTTAHNNTSTHEPVKKLIRLALACEYQRKPLRRADISDKVLPAHQSRQFKRVLADAQTQLQSVFGMELVELPAREKVTVREKRRAGGGSKPAASWVLRSTLPGEFHDPAIVGPPAAPTPAEEGTYTAVYSVLVALIALSGGALPEAKLERYLRRLGMEDKTPVAGHGKTEQLLKRMEREGYLVKVKEAATAGEEDVSWYVGPRGRKEVGDDGVRGLTSAVYGDLNDGEEAELQRRIGRSLDMGGSMADKKVEAEGGEKKKRGRKRKEQQEEEDEDEDDDE